MKPKYKISKSQMRKRKRRRWTIKPDKMWWRQHCREIVQGEYHGTGL